MEQEDRQRILINLDLLERKTRNFDEVFKKLVQYKMFNDYMRDEILAQKDSKRIKFFYEYVTTRGPKAFNQLVSVMNSTDNGHIAAILTDGRISGSKLFQYGDSSNELPLDEEFPHDPNIVWKVRKGEDRFDLNKEGVYKMGSKPKGLVLIVNVRKYVNDTMEERLGSEHDIKRLKETFEQIGYEIETVEDEMLTAKKILEKVVTFSKRDEHWKCDSCIVIIMSHGTYNPATTQTINFQGYDLTTVNSEVIIQQFFGNRCRALIGKPKLFFFQACRGEHLNYAVNKVLERDKTGNGRPIPKEIIDDELNCEFSDLTITAPPEVHEKPETKSAVEIKNALIHPLSKDSPDNHQITENIIKNQLMNGNGCENQLSYGITNKNKPMNGNSNGNQLMTDSHKTANGWSEDHLATGDRVRNDADFFIGFSTTPGNVSRRDPDTGSWFIQILCQMIAKHSWNKDISTILEHIDREIGKKTDRGTKQSIEDVKNLTKKFYFQPGIYDD